MNPKHIFHGVTESVRLSRLHRMSLACVSVVCCQNEVSLQSEDSGEISGFSAVNDEWFCVDCQRGVY